ncbi:MAG: hypothetical protein ACKO15_06770 [Burkholderiales bacterium]
MAPVDGGLVVAEVVVGQLPQGLDLVEDQRQALQVGELLKTYCAGESVSSGARRTLGTCLLLTANFTRSRRFLEVPVDVEGGGLGGHVRLWGG